MVTKVRSILKGSGSFVLIFLFVVFMFHVSCFILILLVFACVVLRFAHPPTSFFNRRYGVWHQLRMFDGREMRDIFRICILVGEYGTAYQSFTLLVCVNNYFLLPNLQHLIFLFAVEINPEFITKKQQHVFERIYSLFSVKCALFKIVLSILMRIVVPQSWRYY